MTTRLRVATRLRSLGATLTLLLGLAGVAGAQVAVTGTITDGDTGEPLLGASVLVKGTDVGTVTDYDGDFAIDAPIGATLLVRYVGYLAEEHVVSRAGDLDVALEPNATALDEVVVVGYGSQRKSDLTGSVSSVSEEELKSLPVTGLDQALQGKAAGVYVTQNSGAPGGGLSIRIRGIGSTLTAEPLYVIDGVPVVSDNAGSSTAYADLGGAQNSNALNTINPNDIESIEILKDASATAIYGARAANGVVLITTKRGKAGQSSVSVESYAGVSQISKRLPVLGLRDYARYFLEVNNGNGPEEFDRLELLGEGTDWQDAIFQRAFNQNHQVTILGGSEATQFALSGGFNQRDGIVIGSDFERFSGRFNVDHRLAERLKVGASLLYARTNERIVFNDNSSGVVYTALLMPPNVPVRNADGTFAGPSEDVTLQFDNPVARALDTDDRNRKTRLLSNLYFEAELTDWLRYRTELGTDNNFSDHRTFYPSFERGDFSGRSGLRISDNQSGFWINKHLLTVDEQFGERHKLSGLLGFEAQKGTYEWLYAARENLPNNELRQLNLGDAGQDANGGGAGHFSLASWFSRVNYTLRERYLFTATARIDGSSRFGPSNRYGFFPSAAVAWRASEEAFLKDVGWLDNLKLRVGVGAVGNQEIGLYSYLANIQGYNAVVAGELTTGFGPVNIANPDVRWESSVQGNIGIDLGLVDNRVSVTLDVYRKQANGMLLPAILPATVGGFAAPFVNIGEINNDGVELTVNTVNVTGAFDWSTSANVTYNRNEVKRLGSTGALTGVIQDLPVTRTEEGRSIGEFYGYRTDGIFQSLDEIAEAPYQADGVRAGDIRFRDLNGDGVINEEDQTFLGSPLPDFTANLTNTIGYKGFELSAQVQGVFGNEILNLLNRDLTGFVNQRNQLDAASARYQPTAPSETVPRFVFNDPNDNRRISDRYIEDGSFIRLRTVNLAYALPGEATDKLRLTNAKVYVSAQNLVTLTDYSGYDPEIGSYNQNPLINGVDNGRYPIAQGLTAGFNATF